MSVASVAAAKIYIAMQSDEAYHEAFCCHPEPFRSVIDHARDAKLHDIVDGSEDYASLVDCLEVLVCD